MYPTEIGVFRSTRSWKKGIPFCTLQGIIYDYTTDNRRFSILLFFLDIPAMVGLTFHEDGLRPTFLADQNLTDASASATN